MPDSCRVHLDYVYFEGSPTDPFLIRRIEELNKVGQLDGLLTFRLTEAFESSYRVHLEILDRHEQR